MKISIAMATYNGAKYLAEQLQSFVDQTCQIDELVVTDDGSTDDTVEIIRAFAPVAPFEVILSVNETNLGYAGNFNAALLKTTGDLVFLSDQDDVWFSEKIERVLSAAQADPESLVFMNDAALTNGELIDTGLTKLGQIRSGGFPDSSFVMGCCAAVRRELLDLCMPIPQGYRAHDRWIVGFADGMGRKKIITRVLQWYRRHDQNESQFIANRTKKINRMEVLVHGIRNAWSSANNGPDGDGIQQQKLFLEGISAAQRKSPEPYSSELRLFAERLDQQRVSMAARSAIRARPRLRRASSVLKLWREGGYKHFSGLKSALRDIMFR